MGDFDELFGPAPEQAQPEKKEEQKPAPQPQPQAQPQTQVQAQPQAQEQPAQATTTQPEPQPVAQPEPQPTQSQNSLFGEPAQQPNSGGLFGEPSSTPAPAPTPAPSVQQTAPASSLLAPAQPQQPTQYFTADQKPMEEYKEPEEFDFTPVKDEQGFAGIGFGDKGSGKTTTIFTLTLPDVNFLGKSREGGDTMAVLSFDGQSDIIKQENFKNSPKITVYDASKYFTKANPDFMVKSAKTTYRFLEKLLTTHSDDPVNKPTILDLDPDWIVLDGLEDFKVISEYRMKAQENLKAYQAKLEWKFWHERTDYMDFIDGLMRRAARKGIWYTAYIKLRKKKDKNGNELDEMEDPDWAGNVKKKTRTVIKFEAETSPDGTMRMFYATVQNSKINAIPTSGRKLVGKAPTKGQIEIIGMKALLGGATQQ